MIKVTISFPRLEGTAFDTFYKSTIYQNTVTALMTECMEYAVKDKRYDISFTVDETKALKINLADSGISMDPDASKIGENCIVIEAHFIDEEIYNIVPKDQLVNCRVLFGEKSTTYKIPVKSAFYPQISITTKDKYTMIDVYGKNYVEMDNRLYKVKQFNDVNFTLEDVISGRVIVRNKPKFKPLTEDEVVAKIQELNFDEIRDEIKCLELVDKDPENLRYIKNQTDNICLCAVKKDGMTLRYVINQTDDICLEAVKQNPYALQYVKNQTEDICKAAVTEDGTVLQFVKSQTDDICLAAVTENGYALEFVKTQTDDICLAAVTENGYALSYVITQTADICKAAVGQNGNAFVFVSNDILTADTNNEIAIAAVTKTPSVLTYINTQTADICKAAVTADPKVLKYVQDQFVADVVPVL